MRLLSIFICLLLYVALGKAYAIRRPAVAEPPAASARLSAAKPFRTLLHNIV
jgi:hypothetical protein